MITLTQVTPTGGDCTAGYRVDLDKVYTVSEFIEEVLKRFSNEWGYFRIMNIFTRIEYRSGKLIENRLEGNVLSAKIVSVTASGGWGNMDYKIIIE